MDPQTGAVILFPSIRGAARRVGLKDHKCISIAIAHPNRTAAGYHWRYPPREIDFAEEWKPIVACDGHELSFIAYSVSSNGGVRNDRLNRPLTPTRTGSGYFVVNLRTSLKARVFMVHRLVATAFCATSAESTRLLDVDHLNCDKEDNRAINLQWMTRMEHQQKTGGRAVVETSPDGEVVGHYPTIKGAAAAVGVNPGSIIDALKGRTITCCGNKWSYLEDTKRKEMDEYIDSILSLF